MAFDISTLVTDRKQSDVVYVKQLIAKIVAGTATEPELAEWKSLTLKGAYNYTDLNRVSAAMEYLRSRLNGYGYATPGYQRIEVPHRTVAVSKLPDGYTQAEYIESNGTQYVNTRFKPNQNTRVVLDFHNSGDYSGMTTSLCPFFGARNGSTSAAFAMWIGTKSFPHYGNVSYNKNGNFTTDINRRLVYDFDKNVVSIGEDFITCATATFTTNYDLHLLAMHNYGSIDSRHTTGKLYSCQIYDDDTLARYFVPVIDPSGVVGLYDLVDGLFYGNSGTGEFTAGPVVEVEEKDPYLWYEDDIPTPAQMAQYIANVIAIRSVLELLSTTPEAPEDMEELTVEEANAIEKIMADVDTVIRSMLKIVPRAMQPMGYCGFVIYAAHKEPEIIDNHVYTLDGLAVYTLDGLAVLVRQEE